MSGIGVISESEAIARRIKDQCRAVGFDCKSVMHPTVQNPNEWVARIEGDTERNITFQRIQTSPCDMFTITAQSESGEPLELTPRTLAKGIPEIVAALKSAQN